MRHRASFDLIAELAQPPRLRPPRNQKKQIKNMNKLYALFPALVLAAGMATSAKAQSVPQQGYFYNVASNRIMAVEGNVVKAYEFNANKLPASLFEFDVNEHGAAAFKNVQSQRYIGKVGGFNTPIGTQTEEFRYKVSTAFDENNNIYYSFADTTSAGSQVSLHNNNGNDVVRWNAGIANENESAPSRWYFISADKMQAYASFQANKRSLKDIGENVLAATQPAYKKVGNALITDVAQLSSNAPDPHEGPIAGLIDNNEDTYFHSSYRAGRPKVANIEVTFDNPLGQKTFQVDYKKRKQNNNNIPTKIAIYGGKKQTNGTIVWEEQPFTTVANDMPSTETNYEGVGAYGGYFQFTADKNYDAFRFNVLRTNTGTDFFTYSEFQLFQTQVNGPKPRVVKHQFVEKGSQIWSDNKEPSEGSYAALLDGKNDTFFHSTWSQNNNKEHNLMFKFDNPEEVKDFKFAYQARNAGGWFNDRPTEIDIYGGTPQGNGFKWEKFKTEKATGNYDAHGVNGIGGYSGILDIHAPKAYSAFKFVVKKTSQNKKFFTYGEISLYSEKTYPAGTTAATADQVVALNKALAGLDQNFRPYEGNPEALETAARNAINDIVPGIVNAATQKQELDALLADAFAKADAAIAKAEEAIKKSDFTTEAMKAKKEENERLLDEVYNLREGMEELYNKMVGGYTESQVNTFKEMLETLLTGVSYINVGTEDLGGLVEEFIDPASRFKLVPIEPWLKADYAVHWDKYSNLQVTRNDRVSKGFRATVNGETTEYLLDQRPENIYNEVLDFVVEAPMGAEVTIEPQYNNVWMHGYVYLDANQDKKFNWNVEPGKTNSEVVAYNHYKGFNSLGESARNQATLDNGFFLMPSFNAPEKPGVYRMRVKIDWNNIDAAGQYNGEYTSNLINNNGGYIFDFTLKVVDPTAISSSTTTTTQAPAFDLSGRRVNKAAAGQVIIVNGKKVIK